MRSNLPQATQTKKLSSLPEDLLSIAEELIAEKFGIEEEVVEQQAPDPFCRDSGCPCRMERTSSSGDSRKATGVFAEQSMGAFTRGGGEIRYGQTWGGGRVAEVRIPSPSRACLVAYLRLMDSQNLSGQRTLLMDRRFFQYLLRDNVVYGEIEYMDQSRNRVDGTVARLFGCNVVIDGGIMGCYLRVTLDRF